MDSQAVLDICGKKIIDYVLDCVVLFNRGYKRICLRAFGSNASRVMMVVRILREKFHTEIIDTKIDSVKLAGLDSNLLSIVLELSPDFQRQEGFFEYLPGVHELFIDYPIYHLLFDWKLNKTKKFEVYKFDKSDQEHSAHLLTITEDEKGLACQISLRKEDDYKARQGLMEALYRAGMMIPGNWNEVLKNLSEFDDIVLGIDTNILYGCNLSEHLLPLLSLAYPKGFIPTPNWTLLVVPSAVMHEIEGASNIRDEKGYLQIEGRLGFRAMQEIIELSQGTDIPGVSLIIVGEADPILDTKVEIQGLREDLARREGESIERKRLRSFKRSSGDMIIRDQFKSFLRCINFHKGTYFLTADKSNAALAKTEAVNPIHLRNPREFTGDTNAIRCASIEVDHGDPVILKVPIGRLLFELAVQWRTIFVEFDGQKVMLVSDSRGDRLENWLNRRLLIKDDSYKSLSEGYEGLFGTLKTRKKWMKLQEMFTGFGE